MKATLNNLQLRAIAATVPSNKVCLSSFYERFGKHEVQRIVSSTGIKSVRIASDGLKTSELICAAAQQLFEQLDVDKKDIDGLVFVSQTPDYRMPATSCLLQDRLGLSEDTVTFDINYGCSGYVYGLYQAGLLVTSGSCKKVLLCVGDTISQHLDPNDQKTQLILGDAAAATVVESGEDSWSFALKSDGAGYQGLIIKKNQAGHDAFLKMDGAAIMEFALRAVPPIIQEVIALKGWDKRAVEQVVFHQANAFMLNYLRKIMCLPSDKVPIAIEHYGNTGPASIPLALCHQFAQGEACNYKNTILTGFGVGLSWGAVALNLQETKFLGVSEV